MEVRDNQSMNTFINELQQLNANPQSNPNDNYEIFERLLVQARDKHLDKECKILQK